MSLYLYVLDTLADWEIGHLTAEVRSGRFFRPGAHCPLVTVGNSRAPVRSMGGMQIVPDLSVGELRLSDEDLLLLPGGDLWFEPAQDAILGLAAERISRDLPMAAICGATLGLARVGALDCKRHTSNDLGYLRAVCPNYAGAERYLEERAVVDRGLVTASGQSALAFSCEVLRLLGVFRPETLVAWEGLYRTNEPRFFYALMESLGREA